MTDTTTHLVADPVPATGAETVADRKTATTRRRKRRLGPGKRIPYGRLLGPLLVLGIWSLLSATDRLDEREVAAPWTVAETGWDLWVHGSLREDITTSATRAGWGFLLGLGIGIVLALTAGLSRIGEALIDGTVQLNRSIPPLGLIPLFILWLGIGESFKIAIITIIVYIPIYLNLFSALSNIDGRYVELAETLKLSRWQFVRQVVVPGSLPGFFVGLRLAVTFSWLALVVLEQINSTNGLGYMMFQAQNYGQTDVIIVGLVIYGILGFTSDAVVRLLERRVLSWRRTLSS